MKAQLKVTTLNVNGLRDPSKRSDIFKWFKLFSDDLIFIQDTRIRPQDISHWNQQWGSQALWTKYTAILTNDKNMTISRIPTVPSDDRFLLAEIEGPTLGKIILASIYTLATFTAC